MAHLSQWLWNLREFHDDRSTAPTRFGTFLTCCMREKHDDVTTSSTTTPEDPTPQRSGVSVDIEMPVHPVNESLESIDEPEATGDPHGYGHGV